MANLPKIANRVKQTLASAPGAGVLVLGAASAGFQTFAEGGFLNGDSLSYVLEDGSDWEIGTGTYSTSGPSIARTVIQSSNNGQLINASASAVVYSTLLAQNAGFSGAIDIKAFNGYTLAQGGAINVVGYDGGSAATSANPFPVVLGDPNGNVYGAGFTALPTYLSTSDGTTPLGMPNGVPLEVTVKNASLAVSGSVGVTSLPAISGTVALSNPYDGVLKLAGQAVSSTNRLPVDVAFPSSLAVTGTVALSNPFDGTLKTSGQAVSNSNPLPVSITQSGIDASAGVKVQWSPSMVVNLYQNSQPVNASNPLGSQIFFSTPSGLGTNPVSNTNPLPVTVTNKVDCNVVVQNPDYATAIIGSATLNGGATPVVLASTICKVVEICNNTSSDIEYQRNGAGAYMTIPKYTNRTIIGLSNANQIGVRRSDNVSTGVTISYEMFI
ncbi:hypothetical protein FF100_22065 [Methylobacterium terricola]|uniref:Uncharacterized protein n=1 Tax=Methylobacterium terricola TaxID=2583531 RepID=A0A5C4LE43_9HYPH|nr:hypothetical protein [Methylobacterium terricola]TNC10839.1 hypothetical protein FF100_22065 [Methylobacterium terricola]